LPEVQKGSSWQKVNLIIRDPKSNPYDLPARDADIGGETDVVDCNLAGPPPVPAPCARAVVVPNRKTNRVSASAVAGVRQVRLINSLIVFTGFMIIVLIF